MKTNEGMIDRALRIVAGLALLTLVFVAHKRSGVWSGWRR